MRVAILLATLLVSGCGDPAEKRGKLELRGEAMGTGWSVVFADGKNAPEGIREVVVEEIGSVEAAMSTYKEDSEVSRFNRLGKGKTMELSEGTAAVVDCALEVWRGSGGAFDITVGGEGGSEDLVFDEARRTLFKKRDGVTIDLSAVAKGYAVDMVAKKLDALGVEDYLVEIGGELRGKGKAPDGSPWTVGIEKPRVDGRWIAGTVELSGRSIATSGNYRQPRHLIDPGSGEPVERPPMAVSVIHESAMVADAWATAFFVLGAEEGLRVADGLGMAVVYLLGDEDGAEPKVRLSKGFRELDAHFRSGK